jgi:imidazolonepropionase
MPVLGNIGLLATCAAGGGQGELHLVPRAAVAWEDEIIRWAGPEADLPREHRGAERWDAGGRLVVPGLVDCHTHLVFGGWRHDEMAQRLAGAGYLELARAGGGIGATVARTRALSPDDLFARAAGFLEEMARLGVTTVEAKSGYGLDVETELRLLRVHRRLDRETPMRVVSTYLGAHAVPAEYRERREAYLALVAEEMIPRVALERLADGVDAYVDEGAFAIEEGRRVLAAARERGLPVRLHADQLACTGGAELAAEMGALSADHLESVSDRGIAALAGAGCVAVTLPIAALYLRAAPAPARRLVEAGVPVAVATDFNPGTAPSYHLPLALTLACTLQRMTPAEAIKGATLYAARALGLEARAGSIEPGKAADLAVIDAAGPEEWLYHFRANACRLTVASGRVTWRAG